MGELLRYNRNRDCPKCARSWVGTKFHRGGECARLIEHMHRTCEGCGYDWIEEPADARSKAE